MFKMIEIVKTANKAVAEIREDKNSNLPQTNHLIYAAATIITEEINGRGSSKSETQSSKHTRGLDEYWRIQMVSGKNYQLRKKQKEMR